MSINIREDLKELFLENALRLLLLRIIPGDKVCKRCEANLNKKLCEQALQAPDLSSRNENNRNCSNVENSNLPGSSRRSERIQNLKFKPVYTLFQQPNKSNISSLSTESNTSSQKKNCINNLLRNLEIVSIENQQCFKSRHKKDF